MSANLKVLSCAAILSAGCASQVEVPPPVPVEPQAEVAVQQPEPPPYIAQVNTLATANPTAKVDHVAFKQVILDGFQAECVVVDDVRRSKTNDGYERVQVLVKNVTDAAIRTRYRFDWQDANGVVVMDPDHAGWEKLTLAPGDDSVFTSIAPKKDCADFRLRMKSVQ